MSTGQLIHDKIVKWLREETSIRVEKIDYDSSLLELGVDSLAAATIACELEEETHKRIDPEVVVVGVLNCLVYHLCQSQAHQNQPETGEDHRHDDEKESPI